MRAWFTGIRIQTAYLMVYLATNSLANLPLDLDGVYLLWIYKRKEKDLIEQYDKNRIIQTNYKPSSITQRSRTDLVTSATQLMWLTSLRDPSHFLQQSSNKKGFTIIMYKSRHIQGKNECIQFACTPNAENQ